MQSDFEKFALRIYDTVADPGLWQPILDEFVDRAGALGCIIFEWEGLDRDEHLTAPLHSGRYSPEVLATYLKKCAHLEARDQDILRQHTSDHDTIELLDDTVLATSVDELQQQEHVVKLAKLGISHRAAGVLNKDNRWISLFSIQFGAESQQIDEEERRNMAKLLPHFAKALDIGLPMRQLEQRNTRVLAAIDQLTIGICILDRNGNVVLRNEEFRRQEETYRTFQINARGQFRMSSGRDQHKFEKLKENVRLHGLFGARPRKEAISTSPDDYLCVEVTPLTKAEHMGSNALEGFVVYSTDTSVPVQIRTSPIQHAFGLTDAEMSLVDAIGQGLTNPEIAKNRGRSVSTINAQVKSILSKSHCSTRTQFVRMMMRFGASFLAPGE